MPRASDSLLQLDLLPAGATKKHAASAESIAWSCVLLWCFAELETRLAHVGGGCTPAGRGRPFVSAYNNGAVINGVSPSPPPV